MKVLKKKSTKIIFWNFQQWNYIIKKINEIICYFHGQLHIASFYLKW